MEHGDAPALRGLCDCRDRAVHAACLGRWVETSMSSECPVCRRAFRGKLGEVLQRLAIRTRHVHALSRTALLVGSMGMLTLSAVLVARGATANDRYGGNAREVVHESIAIGTLLAGCYAYTLGVYCCAAFSGAGEPVLV
jgi:hypothetical protein